MPEPIDLTPLLAVLRDLVVWLHAGKVSGVVIATWSRLFWAGPG